jgi:hypothetical protein
MGFMTNESSGPAGSGITLINALSLVVLDTVCLANQATSELGGVVYFNERLPTNITFENDNKLDKAQAGI